jgi:hypothetical protein
LNGAAGTPGGDGSLSSDRPNASERMARSDSASNIV